MWFERLTGFRETSPAELREKLLLDGAILSSRVNGKRWSCGTLEVVSLDELRRRAEPTETNTDSCVSEVVADIQALHQGPENAHALFQVASQFNLLEMVSPTVTPEEGVGIYERDFTQGPACAIAAGAGTIYRNYFAPVGGGMGQNAVRQIDCLDDLGLALDNRKNRLWKMQNGYALATAAGLKEISERLKTNTPQETDTLRGKLKVGIQWDTEVTLAGCSHTVSQIYCSALPVAYSNHSPGDWEAFARLILEGAYEATLCAALLNFRKAKTPTVFLTLLGGGAFGNRKEWIIEAIERALNLYRHSGLDVRIVSFRNPEPALNPLLTR